MRRLCFTIDMDRDVNEAVPGRYKAVSLDRGQGDAPRFTSSGKGASILLDMLDDIGMKATFFAEATTLRETGVGKTMSGHEVAFHGKDHEDFTGVRTHVDLSMGTMREVTESGLCMIRDDVGVTPKGFRSPYMDANEDMLEFLREYGMVYDASMYVYAGKDTDVYDTEYGIKEVPAVKAKDRNGKTVTSYLWPMHEGKRGYSDFVDLGDIIEDGTLVLATHTWHMAETREKGVMDDDWVMANTENVRRILTELMDKGSKPMTMLEAAQR